MNLVQRLFMAAIVTFIIALVNFEGSSSVVSSEGNLDLSRLNLQAIQSVNR